MALMNRRYRTIAVACCTTLLLNLPGLFPGGPSPSMAQDSAGIYLMEAVRRTLDTNDDIRAQVQQVAAGEGRLQEAAGQLKGNQPPFQSRSNGCFKLN